MTDVNIVPASYKDPAGFVFTYQDEKIYRQVNSTYAGNYDLLMKSGLYDELTKKKYLLSHTEINEHISGIEGYYKTLLPQQLSFISYPYEWSFDMLKDAALLTLSINSIAIEYGMILKDATPYNIQFLDGKPLFIDTLSFEKYNSSQPWIAYRQFCEMFLYPLALSHYSGENLQQMLQLHINGISVQLTAAILPWRTRLNLHMQLHVFLQKKIIQKAKNDRSKKNYQFDEQKMKRLIQGLELAIKNLSFKTNLSNWDNYYEETILSQQYLEAKKQIVDSLLNGLKFETVIDLGSNDGYFSLLAAQKKASVISIDNDNSCINRLYNQCKGDSSKKITALLVSLVNPTPAIGWANTERTSFLQRAKADVVMALALIHHLCISNNLPFENIAHVLKEMGKYIIIEFVPKDDEKVKLLLNEREDIFYNYNIETFEDKMSSFFYIENKQQVAGSERVIYLLKNKQIL